MSFRHKHPLPAPTYRAIQAFGYVIIALSVSLVSCGGENGGTIISEQKQSAQIAFKIVIDHEFLSRDAKSYDYFVKNMAASHNYMNPMAIFLGRWPWDGGDFLGGSESIKHRVVLGYLKDFDTGSSTFVFELPAGEYWPLVIANPIHFHDKESTQLIRIFSIPGAVYSSGECVNDTSCRGAPRLHEAPRGIPHVVVSDEGVPNYDEVYIRLNTHTGP